MSAPAATADVELEMSEEQMRRRIGKLADVRRTAAAILTCCAHCAQAQHLAAPRRGTHEPPTPPFDLPDLAHASALALALHPAATPAAVPPPTCLLVVSSSFPDQVTLDDVAARYELGEELGRGRFSEVMSAVHLMERTKYAIKVVENESLADEENLEALETEVATLKTCPGSPLDLPGISPRTPLDLRCISAGSLLDLPCAGGDPQDAEPPVHRTAQGGGGDGRENVHRDGAARRRRALLAHRRGGRLPRDRGLLMISVTFIFPSRSSCDLGEVDLWRPGAFSNRYTFYDETANPVYTEYMK